MKQADGKVPDADFLVVDLLGHSVPLHRRVAPTTRSRDEMLPSVLFALKRTSATNTVPSPHKLPVGGDEFKGG
jgi:hypothetical protein